MNDTQNRAAALTKDAPRSPSAKKPVVALLKPEQQPFALMEDSEHRIAAMAGAATAFSMADEATQGRSPAQRINAAPLARRNRDAVPWYVEGVCR